jgi:GNAT superfamily N-acetyltransferase
MIEAYENQGPLMMSTSSASPSPPAPSSWRRADAADDATIIELALALAREDPGPNPLPAEHVTRTLRVLRDEPWRGVAAVLHGRDGILGYAFLISFWSNELGGEVCTIDELYVVPDARGMGLGSSLFDAVLRGGLWPGRAVALELETTPSNARARALYQRSGFTGGNVALRRLA